VITFDDGYADFYTEALPILERFGFAATVFVTTGWLADAGPHAAGRPLDRTLTWSQVKEAAAHGVELAGHSHSHPQLDQIDGATLREELGRNKALLEDELGRPVTTMAYPYGYSNARVRRAVAAAGYEAACAVNNALAAPAHDRFAMPRLTVGRSTTMAKFQAAVAGRGVPALYRKERTLTNYFNRAAFAQPEPGTYGNEKRNALVGPHFWNVDLAVSRQVSVGGMQTVELRLETFNLFNTFNWGDPGMDQAAGGTIANINSGLFGRITTQAGTPRIIQLGVKYTF